MHFVIIDTTAKAVEAIRTRNGPRHTNLTSLPTAMTKRHKGNSGVDLKGNSFSESSRVLIPSK